MLAPILYYFGWISLILAPFTGFSVFAAVLCFLGVYILEQ